MKILDFCKLECEIQQDSSLESILQMVDAFYWARDLGRRYLHLNLDDILELGFLVKPHKNAKGFRTTPVIFKDLSLGLAPELIENSLRNLVQASNQHLLTAEEFYQEFESIHPFEDGNGRVGAILYNMFHHSMDYPELPPKYKRSK